MLNVIPHALRTPITTFRGLADSLSDATEAEIRTTIAPALQRLAAQAESLLDDMLLAAGLTTTLPTGPREAVAVAETAQAAWHAVAPDRAPLQVDEESPGMRAVVQRGSLYKMFIHVLDNAAKYGTSDPSIRLSVRGGRLSVVVDSPGDEVPEVEMLGEPFFRTERAVMSGAGLGVGLVVARALAEHAGGTLQVERRVGGGLMTTIELEAP